MRPDESESDSIGALLQMALQKATSGDSSSSGSKNHDIIIPPIFTDEYILRRPPFSYIYALVKFFVQQKSCLLSCSKELLFPDTTLQQQQQQLSRKEQLTFITRILVLVSQISGRRRFDVLISPSNILCGRDVNNTHEFLRALATIIISSSSTVGGTNVDAVSKAVQHVLEVGDTTLYKRGVQKLTAITSERDVKGMTCW